MILFSDVNMRKGIKVVDIIMLSTFFLYPLIFMGAEIKIFNSTRFVWGVILPVLCLWLTFNYRKYDIKSALRFMLPFTPILFSATILSIYHHSSIEMESMSKLIILCVAFGALVVVYPARTLYAVNSIFCIATLFWMAFNVHLYGLGVPTDAFNGVLNINIVYPMIVMMSGVSCLASQKSMGREKYFHVISGLAGLCAVILTQARGGLVDIIVLLVFFFSVTKIHLKLKILILLLMLAVCSGYMYVTDGYHGKIMKIFTEIPLWFEGKEQSSSIGARFSLWYAGLVDIFPRFPWMGTGVKLGNLAEITKLVSLTERPGWEITSFAHFHNDFVHMLVRGGIIYLVSGVLSLALLIAKYKSHVIILWMITCAVVTGMTDIFYFHTRSFIFFTMILALMDAEIHRIGKVKLGLET